MYHIFLDVLFLWVYPNCKITCREVRNKMLQDLSFNECAARFAFDLIRLAYTHSFEHWPKMATLAKIELHYPCTNCKNTCREVSILMLLHHETKCLRICVEVLFVILSFFLYFFILRSFFLVFSVSSKFQRMQSFAFDLIRLAYTHSIERCPKTTTWLFGLMV